MKPHILILSFSDMKRDPRVYRQIQALRHDYQLTAIGMGDPDVEGVRFCPVEVHPSGNGFERAYRAGHLLLGNYLPYLQGRYRLKKPLPETMSFDAVIANDLEPLPLGFTLAQGAPVIFDAHEYYPEEQTVSFFWRLFFRRPSYALCRKVIPQCAGMVTVCPGIAKAYQETFGLLPEVMFNAPFQQVLAAKPVASERIRLIHHGGANPDRHLEVMLDMMRFTDARFTLDMMLVGQEGYIRSLKERYVGQTNIIWRDPVPMQALAATLNVYDIGLHSIAPTSFNNTYALPNKFFEFIQARLGIAIGPSPEMAAIAKEHDLGVIADDFTPQALAAKLNALTPEDIMSFKHNADKAAAIYNAEASMEVLKTMLQRVLEEGNA